MGGHGGLNILPQKRWNVYRRDNRLRVRRDEEQHREEQQQRRQQDERQRMSNVLILLKRKKAEAQARRQQRHSATAGDAKAQIDNVQPSTTSGCSQSDGSHAAWLSTLVDFSGSCKSFSAVSEVVRCGQPGVTRCHAGVGDRDREFSVTGPSCSVIRDGPCWAHSSCAAEVVALAACRGASSMPSGCVYSVPAGGCSSDPGAEIPGEALESLIVDHPGVVRVRLPTTTYTRADSVVPSQNSHAVVASSAAGYSADTSLECVAYATSLETGIEFVECEAQVVNQPNAAVGAGHTVTSAPVATPPPQEQQQQGEKGQSQHVNLFEAEENEMRKLELRRKKYLLSAGYTPGARSEFEEEIRASLTQTPWYYRPPSASKPPASSSLLHAKELLGAGLPHYWPQALQQVPAGSGEEAVAKQRPAAALPMEFAEQNRGRKEQGQDGETCRSGYPPETLTSPQPVPVQLEGQHEREEQHCYSRKSDAPILESEPRRRRAYSNGRDKGRNVLTRESRKKTKRLRKDKQASVDRQKDEDDVECLQVTVLVEDEEEDGVT